jgi:DNA-binding HxlR family transcriptional regulator
MGELRGKSHRAVDALMLFTAYQLGRAAGLREAERISQREFTRRLREINEDFARARRERPAPPPSNRRSFRWFQCRS